ncbi:intracellular protein transport protein USO1-like [Myzus persicae]|uniref:intracellular protein transport protein USO1-like n=1 Tax=Myzus persicae TaxID=13164 RepID=UPI000B938A40|nr:intracellular protein transport protein USO1-like [Myzus persicae]
MANNIIPQEDNTSEILRADILKYGYINKRNKLRKNKTNANPAKRQEWAIRFLEEERNNLTVDLNAMESKEKSKVDEKYRAKFISLIHQTKQAKIDLNEQRKIEEQVNKEIVLLEAELEKLTIKNRMANVDVPTLTTNTVNYEYNRLIEEQNQLKIQVENLLKRWQQIQNIYNSHMKKLNKGKEIASILSEQVARTYTYRNEAKERLETYLKTSNTQTGDYENRLVSLKRQVNEDLRMTTFLSQKLKLRHSKQTEEPQVDNTEMLALNVEAETFIKHLIHIADEKNLEKIMDQIVKMDLDNKCMFRFLMEIESYLTNAEKTIEETRIIVSDRKRELCETQAAKTDEFASAMKTLKSGRTSLREARRTLRLMADEWRQTCRTVDDACKLMMGRDSRRPSYSLLVRDDGRDGQRGCEDDDEHCRGGEEEGEDEEDGEDEAEDEAEANESDDHDGGRRQHRRRGRHRRRRRRGRPRGGRLSPTAIVTEVVEYFEPIDRRLDDVLQRVFWIQNNYVGGDSGPREQLEVPAGESMSTTSDQEDEFLARDLDGTVNRHSKIIAALDPTTVTVDNEAPPPPDGGQVSSLCPRCLEKRYEEENQWVLRYIDKFQGDSVAPPTASLVCQNKNVSFKDIDDEEFKKYFHRTLDCPLYTAEKFHAK